LYDATFFFFQRSDGPDRGDSVFPAEEAPAPQAGQEFPLEKKGKKKGLSPPFSPQKEHKSQLKVD
jgi:hypothetical protein